MPWEAAAARLGIVPDPGAGNTLTMAQYADNIYATAQWVQAHAPNS
jgi:hypothetical protein